MTWFLLCTSRLCDGFLYSVKENIIICIMVHFPHWLIHPLLQIQQSGDVIYADIFANEDVPTPTICTLDMTFSFSLKPSSLIPLFLFPPFFFCHAWDQCFPAWNKEITQTHSPLPPSFSACLHRIRFFFKSFPVTHALMHPNYTSERITCTLGSSVT